MVFKSVFDSLSEVQDAIESGRVDAEKIHVNLDKNSVGVFLYNTGEYFEGYTDDVYLMSPGGEHEHQCLYYGKYPAPQVMLVEMVSEFLGGVETNYRGDDEMTTHVSD